MAPTRARAVSRRFGRNLRAARLAAGMTRERLSEASGVRASEIAAIERGGCSPTLKVVGPLARALGRGVWELLAPSPARSAGPPAEPPGGRGRGVAGRPRKG